MSTTYGNTRWWENYAVRYLMPSVAGVAIVKWICWHGCNKLLPLLYLPVAGEHFETSSLVLLFLYGNLFCYVASYPILIFHATRALDFSGDRWKWRIPLDGYIATGLLTLAAFLLTHAEQSCRFWLAFVFAFTFAIIQIDRIWLVFAKRTVLEGCKGVNGEEGGDVNFLYGYCFALATRRAKRIKVEEKTTTSNGADDDESIITKRGEAIWQKDYMETYRHLREHGNSAFIFLLELALAALVYCVVKPENNEFQQLSAIGVLFAIWAIPAIFVHLIGQYLERRFSHFERRLPDKRATE
jgi:hypothetical protein